MFQFAINTQLIADHRRSDLGDQFLGILASRQPTGIVHPMGMVHPTFKLSAPARDPLPGGI